MDEIQCIFNKILFNTLWSPMGSYYEHYSLNSMILKIKYILCKPPRNATHLRSSKVRTMFTKRKTVYLFGSFLNKF